MSNVYIDPPIITDPDELAAGAFATIQAQFPGWNPSPGDLLTIAIEASAAMDAETANVAAAVPKAIFRFFGPLVGVTPIDAVSATVPSTWTMVDDAGYKVPAGTLVLIPGPGGTTFPFSVLSDVIVPQGSTMTDDGEVTLIAITPGSASSGLGAINLAVAQINILSYIAGVSITEPTSGGIDAETDTAFLNRLTAELRLLSPRPIIPSDFAALSLSIAGVGRALAIDLYQPAINQVETVTVVATGGTFTLTYGGNTTAAIAWNAPAVDIQSALELLVSIGAGNVLCSGGPVPTSPVTVEFIGALAGTSLTAMTASATSLTGTSHSVTIATPIHGAVAIDDQARTVTVALVDPNGNPVSGGSKTGVSNLLEQLREVNFIVNVIDPTFNEVDVTATFNVATGYDPDAVATSVEAALAAFLSPASWGSPVGDTALWEDTPTVRLGDLFAVVANVQGVAHAVTVGQCLHGGSPSATDLSLTGPAALTTDGTIEATAV